MNKQIKKNRPALRFPEFEGEWESKKLDDITVWASGGTPSKNEKKYWNGEIPWISASSMRGNYFDDSDLKITEEGLANGSRLAPKGTILILVRGSMLFKAIPVGIATTDVAFNQDVKSIRVKKNNLTEFLLYWFVASENKLLHMVTGTGIGAGKLDLQELKNLNIHLPPLPEQKKIAQFLTAIDTRLQQLTQKVALLEDYKKGVLQQLFSRRIRFRDEQGEDFPEWEERRAKDIFKNHSNKNHNGDLPILAITQENGAVYRDSLDMEIQSSEKSVQSYKIVEPGDFIISLRSFQGGIEYSGIKGICSPAYTILKPQVEISNLFFKHYFKKESFIRQLSATVIGIRDGKQISYGAFSGMKLLFPCVEEQHKIAAFLEAIDRKIELARQQLEQTQQYKKGLLQQMFV